MLCLGDNAGLRDVDRLQARPTRMKRFHRGSISSARDWHPPNIIDFAWNTVQDSLTIFSNLLLSCRNKTAIETKCQGVCSLV